MAYSWQVVAPNWGSLSDADKITLFNNTGHQIPTAADLQAVYASGGNFQIAIYDILSSGTHLYLKGRPVTQLVKPTSLVPLKAFDTVLSIMIKEPVTTGATVKTAVTLDMIDYYVYDISGVWDLINVDTDIETMGMTPSQFNSIPSTAWSLLDLSKGIGIAYSITAEQNFSSGAPTSPSDLIPAVNAIEVQGKLTASWMSQIQGTVYDYEYVMDDMIKVYFYQKGNYKVNYCSKNASGGGGGTGGGYSSGIVLWSPSTHYDENTLIYWDNNIFRATSSFTSGTTFTMSDLEMLGGTPLTAAERTTIVNNFNSHL